MWKSDQMLLVLCSIVFLLLACDAEQDVTTDWDRASYPNPTLESGRGKCGRFGKLSHVCDPNHILSASNADQLDHLIENVKNSSLSCPCSRRTCKEKPFGYRIGVALMKKMSVTTEESEHMKDLDKDEQATYMVMQNLDKAYLFAYTLLLNWDMGNCDEGIIILYSEDDNVLYTVIGKTVQNSKLSQNNIAEIQMASRKYFGPGQQTFEGLKKIIVDFGQALEGHYTPPVSYNARAAAWSDSTASDSSIIQPTLLILLVSAMFSLW